MNLPDAIAQYLASQEADQNSAETIKWYAWHLGQFAAQIGELALDSVTTALIRTYINDLGNASTHYSGGMLRPGPLSPSTITGRKRALRAFFYWCMKEELLERSPMRNIVVQQAKPGEVFKALDLDAWPKLLAVTGDGPLGKRDRALLAFTIDTGARSGSVISLLPENLFLDQRYARVRVKGDRIQSIAFVGYTAKLLEEWLKVRPENATTVFCNLWRAMGQPLTVFGLREIFLKLKKRAEVSTWCNPQAFRKSFGRYAAMTSHDIARVSKEMGHSNILLTNTFYNQFTVDARSHAEISPITYFEKGDEVE